MSKRSIATVVASVVAALVAGGGIAAASGYLITSVHQIKPSVRAALKGTRGPRGFVGATGAPGPAGADGTTHGYGTVVEAPVDITAYVRGPQFNLHPLGQLSLPAGTFLVDAKADYSVIGPAGASNEFGLRCRLRDSSTGGIDLATAGGWLGAPNSVSQGGVVGTVSMAGDVFHAGPATEIVECGDTSAVSGFTYAISDLVIQAVQVNKFN